MERQGRIHRKVLPDGTAAGDIAVWNGTDWVIGSSGDITGTEDGTAQGQMKFWDATLSSWVHTEVTELFWDDVNKCMGINDATPDAGARLDAKGTVMMTRLLAGGVSES